MQVKQVLGLDHLQWSTTRDMIGIGNVFIPSEMSPNSTSVSELLYYITQSLLSEGFGWVEVGGINRLLRLYTTEQAIVGMDGGMIIGHHSFEVRK